MRYENNDTKESQVLRMGKEWSYGLDEMLNGLLQPTKFLTAILQSL